MKSPSNQSLNKLHWYVVLQIEYTPPSKKQTNKKQNKTWKPPFATFHKLYIYRLYYYDYDFKKYM